MTAWLALARGAAAVNVVLLLALAGVWGRNYRRHGATHTQMLLVFAAFLLVENVLWLYFYVVHAGYIGWFVNAGRTVQAGTALLCGLELVALLFLGYVTMR